MPTRAQQTVETKFVYEVADTESLSEAVVTAISTASGTDPVPDASSEADSGLDPLYTVIDPDALDSVFRSPEDRADTTTGQVTFRYHGYVVTVHSGGRIFLQRLAPGADHVP